MVIVSIGGGLGNQLFRYAIGRSLALKLNTKLKLDLSGTEGMKNSDHCYYVLDAFNIKETSVATKKDLESINETEWKIWTDKNKPPINFGDNVFIKEANTIQREDYFVDIADLLKKEFTLKNPMHKVSASWKKKILAAECSVSIHVRHGCFIHPFDRSFMAPLLPVDYYRRCVNELLKDFPNLTVFVFSDDIDWTKENLNFGVPTEFVEGCETDVEEMMLISFCKHNIISFSTFSWWGAWLNKNPNKKILTSSNYIESTKDFIKIPVPAGKVSYTELQLPPTVSIIVYVEDKDTNLEFTLMSILRQPTRDYEVIIVDSSKNDVGNICRKFATVENFTVLKVKNTIDKYAAFNMGLNCARGLYVSFLTGNNFLVQSALYSLFNILKDEFMNNYFHKYSEIKERIKFSSYERVMNGYSSDVFFSVNILDENENGSVNLNDKKFNILCDESFVGLNKAEYLVLNNFQKMRLLAENKVNDLLGTKFFKLKFLNENQIRFKQNESSQKSSAALLFLTETMLLTEKIAFVPSIFIGITKSTTTEDLIEKIGK